LIEVNVDQKGAQFKLIEGDPITIDVAGKALKLTK
jgi:maltose phosphorylase